MILMQGDAAPKRRTLYNLGIDRPFVMKRKNFRDRVGAKNGPVDGSLERPKAIWYIRSKRDGCGKRIPLFTIEVIGINGFGNMFVPLVYNLIAKRC